MGSLFGGGDNNDAIRTVQQAGEDAQNILRRFQPVSLNAGGLQSTFANNQIGITASPERQQAVGGLASTFANQAQQLGALREQVAPGFGRLTSSRLQEVENARRRAIGNLQENLARRRVLGSSFAQDALTRGELEFAQEAEKAAAESFVQELELTNQLINQQFEAARGEFQTILGEMNLETALGQELASQATNVLAQLTQARANAITSSAASEANLIVQSQQGQGSLLGSLLNIGGTLLTAPTTGGGSLFANAFA